MNDQVSHFTCGNRKSKIPGFKQGAPDPVDVAVGAALRQLRCGRKIGMSDLARHLGLSYQQIQKYERGRNRMVASTLFRIADFFRIEIGDLFAPVGAMRESGTADTLVMLALPRDETRRFASEQELARVMTCYSRISNENLRDGVGQLIERLAAETNPEGGVLNGARRDGGAP